MIIIIYNSRIPQKGAYHHQTESGWTEKFRKTI